jgi:hypothetical protein
MPFDPLTCHILNVLNIKERSLPSSFVVLIIQCEAVVRLCLFFYHYLSWHINLFLEFDHGSHVFDPNLHGQQLLIYVDPYVLVDIPTLLHLSH